MEAEDYWRLADELTIQQAALLLAGVDVAEHEHVENWPASNRPLGYDPAKWAMAQALKGGRLAGSVRAETKTEYEPRDLGSNGVEVEIPGSVDVTRSIVEVESLRSWLRDRGITSGFFFPPGEPTPDFLDPTHNHYAPKLAAAVSAWRAMNDPELWSNTSPKKAMMKWLRVHAAAFDLTDADGNPNETGIEEIAKVCNWAPGGGAPKTSAG